MQGLCVKIPVSEFVKQLVNTRISTAVLILSSEIKHKVIFVWDKDKTETFKMKPIVST